VRKIRKEEVPNFAKCRYSSDARTEADLRVLRSRAANLSKLHDEKLVKKKITITYRLCRNKFEFKMSSPTG
jgi:hypothetical protein